MEAKLEVDNPKALVRYLRENKTMGLLMTILLRTSQLMSGNSIDIFQNPQLELQYMDSLSKNESRQFIRP